MINVWCSAVEQRSAAQFWDRDTLLSTLEGQGLVLQRVEGAGSSGITLLFAPLEDPVIASLAASARRRVVLVGEGETPEPEEAESTREATGLLGLVEPKAWSTWKHGPYVAWGFYGQPEVATAAKLEPIGTQGLQPVGMRAPLPEVLARFLAAAESLSTK